MDTSTEEGLIMADMSILEFYLHRSIEMRLAGLDQEGKRDGQILDQAKALTLIVQDILKVISQKFDGEIPFDSVMKKRLIFGAVLGLIFFYETSVPSPVSRFEGYSFALPLLHQMYLSTDSIGIRKTFLSLKNIMFMWSFTTKEEALSNYDSVFSGFLPEDEFKEGKELLALVENANEYKMARASAMSEEKRDIFEEIALDAFRDLYKNFEAPLISKLTSANSAPAEQSKSQQSPLEFYTQAPADFTQAQPESEDVTLPASTQTSIHFEPTTQVTPLKINTSGNNINLDTEPDISDILQTSPVVLPKSSQGTLQLDKSQQSTQTQTVPTQKIPFEVFPALLKACNEDPLEYFEKEDPILDKAYSGYIQYLKDKEREKGLPPMKDLLPKECEDVKIPPKKKKITFESDKNHSSQDFEDPGKKSINEDNKAKKSLLLPDESAKKVTWDSLTSSPSKMAERSPAPARILVESPKMTQPPAAATVTKKPVKGRRPFSHKETEFLKEGLRRFGKKWAIILATYDFDDRTQVDLKDKARNLKKRGEITY